MTEIRVKEMKTDKEIGRNLKELDVIMEREAYFDNAKLILIFFVVFGHMLQPFTNDSVAINTLYTWIYTFHMPAFIFIAGFFAKGSGNMTYITKLMKRLLIPYVVFQIIYTAYYFFIGKSNWLTDSIFYPHWSLWFLFSLFCWHILLIVYKKIRPKYGIAIALFIGVVIGYFDQVGHMFSLSRTFVFFPYFLIGYWATRLHIRQLQRPFVRGAAVIIMTLSAFVIYLLPDINTGWLLASKSYSTLGVEMVGSFARLSVYITSTLMAASLLAWMPSRRFSFTYLGERTLYVYLLHGFIVQFFRQTDLLQMNSLLDFLLVVSISLLTVFVLSTRWVVSVWQPLIEGSTSMLRSIFDDVKEADDRSSC